MHRFLQSGNLGTCMSGNFTLIMLRLVAERSSVLGGTSRSVGNSVNIFPSYMFFALKVAEMIWIHTIFYGITFLSYRWSLPPSDELHALSLMFSHSGNFIQTMQKPDSKTK